MDYTKRIANTAKEMAADGVAAQLVTDAASIRWLTGFAGSSAICLVTVNGAVTLISDSRYTDSCLALEPVRSGAVSFAQGGPREWPNLLKGLVAGNKVEILGSQITLSLFQHLETELELEVGDNDRILKLRLVKDKYEVELMRAALNIAEAAFKASVTEAITGKRTEAEIRSKLDANMLLGGADTIGFETMVANGENSIKPHSTPSSKLVDPNELTVIDWGAEVGGYKSDTSRTICQNANSDQVRLHSTIQEALRQATNKIAPGTTYGAVKTVADEIITANGYGDNILHPFGHNVGLDIHERPFFAARGVDAEQILEAGHVVALEPAAYVPGVGGVRLENLILVTNDGCEVFNNLPLDLAVG